MPHVREVIEQCRSVNLKGDKKIAIIGSGVGGIAMAYALKNAGAENFVIYEKASSLGGTWRENVYPGVACDVPSYAYSFTFALNPEWSRTFPPGDEIRQYLQNTADRFGLTPHIRFNAEVVSTRYQDGQWHLEMANGEKNVVDVVIACTGFLHYPNEISLPGLETFSGPVLHTAKWDKSVDLKGKRVAQFGVGSTGSQVILALVDQVEQLEIFQRGTQWVFPSECKTHSEEDKERLRADQSLLGKLYDELLDESQEVLWALAEGDPEVAEEYMGICLRNLEIVEDPELRKRLTPDYKLMCKRIVAAEGFYEAIQKDNCRIVWDPVKAVEENGIRTVDGVLYPVDIIVMATGYKSKEYFRSINPVGIDGITLNEAWADGVSSFSTVSFSGFPNLFAIGGPFSAGGNQSYIAGAELQSGYIVRLIDMLEKSDARALAPFPEAEQRFRQENAEGAQETVWLSGCKSWFLDENNNFQFWTRSPAAYTEMMKEGPQASDFKLFY